METSQLKAWTWFSFDEEDGSCVRLSLSLACQLFFFCSNVLYVMYLMWLMTLRSRISTSVRLGCVYFLLVSVCQQFQVLLTSYYHCQDSPQKIFVLLAAIRKWVQCSVYLMHQLKHILHLLTIVQNHSNYYPHPANNLIEMVHNRQYFQILFLFSQYFIDINVF